jgi:hypothetical protein
VETLNKAFWKATRKGRDAGTRPADQPPLIPVNPLVGMLIAQADTLNAASRHLEYLLGRDGIAALAVTRDYVEPESASQDAELPVAEDARNRSQAWSALPEVPSKNGAHTSRDYASPDFSESAVSDGFASTIASSTDDDHTAFAHERRATDEPTLRPDSAPEWGNGAARLRSGSRSPDPSEALAPASPQDSLPGVSPYAPSAAEVAGRNGNGATAAAYMSGDDIVSEHVEAASSQPDLLTAAGEAAPVQAAVLTQVIAKITNHYRRRMQAAVTDTQPVGEALPEEVASEPAPQEPRAPSYLVFSEGEGVEIPKVPPYIWEAPETAPCDSTDPPADPLFAWFNCLGNRSQLALDLDK